MILLCSGINLITSSRETICKIDNITLYSQLTAPKNKLNRSMNYILTVTKTIIQEMHLNQSIITLNPSSQSHTVTSILIWITVTTTSTELQVNQNWINEITHPAIILYNREEVLYSKDRELLTQTIGE